MTISKQFVVDVVERAVWTGAQAAVGVLTTTVATDVPPEVWWAVPVSSLLSTLKGIVARQIGDPNSASTAPGV